MLSLTMLAKQSRQINVKKLNRKETYHCDNYTLKSINGKWTLFLDGIPIINETKKNFFEIADTFTWYRKLTQDLFQLVGRESIDELEREEKNFFSRSREEVLNEYHTPSTRV